MSIRMSLLPSANASAASLTHEKLIHIHSKLELACTGRSNCRSDMLRTVQNHLFAGPAIKTWHGGTSQKTRHAALPCRRLSLIIFISHHRFLLGCIIQSIFEDPKEVLPVSACNFSLESGTGWRVSLPDCRLIRLFCLKACIWKILCNG